MEQSPNLPKAGGTFNIDLFKVFKITSSLEDRFYLKVRDMPISPELKATIR